MSKPSFPTNKSKQNLNEQVYEQLKDLIIRDELKQGDLLSENELAKRFGVSRTPVREAVRSLVNEGFVEVRNGVGTFVNRITNREVLDIFEVRACLECLAATTAIAHISDEELNEQEAGWRELAKRYESGETIDYKEILALDDALHALLVNKSENQALKEMIHEIGVKITRLQYISLTALSDTRSSIRQHLEIIAIIRRRESALLEPVLRGHILQGARYIVDRNIL